MKDQKKATNNFKFFVLANMKPANFAPMRNANHSQCLIVLSNNASVEMNTNNVKKDQLIMQ